MEQRVKTSLNAWTKRRVTKPQFERFNLFRLRLAYQEGNMVQYLNNNLVSYGKVRLFEFEAIGGYARMPRKSLKIEQGGKSTSRTVGDTGWKVQLVLFNASFSVLTNLTRRNSTGVLGGHFA